MNTYAEQSFCEHSPRCANRTCPHWFGDADNRAAVRAGLPVALWPHQLTCGTWKPVDGRMKLPAGLTEQERGLAP